MMEMGFGGGSSICIYIGHWHQGLGPCIWLMMNDDVHRIRRL